MKVKQKIKENVEENSEKTKDQILLKESQEQPERRVSFAATARIRVFNTADSTSENETPNKQNKEIENPFGNNKKETEKKIRKKTKTIISSPLTTVDQKDMDITECVGGIIDKAQKDSFVEQLSPIIVTKELPERLSWCFNPTETMNITDNVGKILKDEYNMKQGDVDNIKKDTKEDDNIPFIKDIPEPVFEQMNSPFVEKWAEKTPKKEEFSRRRSSIRYSTGSRLDSYPTPLFPRIKTIEQTKVKAPSPCIEETLPKITIKDFLSLVGIRFLDGLTSFTRRDTLLFDRKAEKDLNTDELVYRGLICTEEHIVYEKGCTDIIEMINKSRSNVDYLEKEFGFNRPTVCSQFSNGNEQEKDEITTKLKALKTSSRTHAKNKWYLWRLEHCSSLKKCFDSLCVFFDKEEESLNEKKPLIEECELEINELLSQKTTELISLREKEEAYHTMDWTRFRELEELAEKQKKELDEYEKRVEKSREEANVVDLLLKEEVERENKLEEELNEYYEICKKEEETSSSIIEKLSFGYSVLEFICGWRLNKLTETQIKLTTNGDIPVDLTVCYNTGFVCTNIQIQTTHQDNFTHKCVSILREECFSPNIYFPDLLRSILSRLDGWALLRKDLKNVRFFSLLSDKIDTQRHVYKATLLQESLKRRIDVLFDATNYPVISILSAKTIYGNLLKEEKIFDLHQKISSELKSTNTVVTSFLQQLLKIK